MKAAFAHSVRQFGVSAMHELRTSADMDFPSHGRRERSYTDVFQVLFSKVVARWMAIIG